MSNPWLALPHQAPFVLPEDANIIGRYNQTATESKRIRLELLPEPFLGDPDSLV